MFGLGLTELVIILIIVLLLFGVGRISGLMRDLGKGVTAFKEGLRAEGPTAPAVTPARAAKAPRQIKAKPGRPRPGRASKKRPSSRRR